MTDNRPVAVSEWRSRSGTIEAWRALTNLDFLHNYSTLRLAHCKLQITY